MSFTITDDDIQGRTDLYLPGLCFLSWLNSVFEFLWRILYVMPNRSLIQFFSVSAGVLNNSWKVRVQNTFAFTWLAVNMRTILFLLRKIMQKSELENRHGRIRQLTAQTILQWFSGRLCAEEKSYPKFSLSHGYLSSVQCWGMPYSASPLVSPWSLALPSFELNSFLIFKILPYLQHLDFVAVSTNCLVTRVCSWTENCLSWNHHCKTTCY